MPYQAYLGIKHYRDHRNRDVIDFLSSTLLDLDVQTICIARDFEKWGKVELGSQDLMRVSFEQIHRSDFIVLEMTEKGVGLGIEAGYAVAIGKPLIVLTKKRETVSTTLQGIADAVVEYSRSDASEVLEQFKTLINRLVASNDKTWII
jgi:nucleoside 2-deoxyribosyltransferase